MPHTRICIFKKKYVTFEHRLTEIFKRKFYESGLFKCRTHIFSYDHRNADLNGSVKKASLMSFRLQKDMFTIK